MSKGRYHNKMPLLDPILAIGRERVTHGNKKLATTLKTKLVSFYTKTQG